MSVLSNVKCRWASVIEPNQSEYGTAWEIEAELSEEQANLFSAKGLTIKEDDKGTKLLRFKRKKYGNKRDGSSYECPAPIVVDAAKNEFNQLVGNGSVVNIAYELRPWDVNGRKGVSARLNAVQVIDHVPYAGGTKAVDEFDVVEAVGADDIPF